MAVRSSVPLHFFPFEFLNLKFSLRARSPAVAEHQAAVLLPSPTNHITAAATLVLARFSLRARCCFVIGSGVPGIADAARGGEVGLFELPSTSASVAYRVRPPHTEGSEARLLEKLVSYTASLVLSCLVVFDAPPPPSRDVCSALSPPSAKSCLSSSETQRRQPSTSAG